MIRNDSSNSNLDGKAQELPAHQSLRLCVEKCWDWMQSREGRKHIRNFTAPFFLLVSLVFVIIGATWTKYLEPECGIDINSAKFTISVDKNSNKRLLNGNGCPGYNWLAQKQSIKRETAGEYSFNYELYLNPIISLKPYFVGKTNSFDGPIGIALNGVAIWGPSKSDGDDTIINEYNNYDQCGGISTPPSNFAFSAPITGYYHYRIMPGTSNVLNSPISLCSESIAWYDESKGTSNGHSPIIGFMADGIPIYGPYSTKGKQPNDLDICGGHASDEYKYYHYHFQPKYPYSVNCLRGCVDTSMNTKFHDFSCTPNMTLIAKPSKYNDYSSLSTFVIKYGGDGINSTNWSGPASLLAFGFIIFIPSSMCSICICFSSKTIEYGGDVGIEVENPMWEEPYDEHVGDNIL